jgi:hypothetical protein
MICSPSRSIRSAVSENWCRSYAVRGKRRTSMTTDRANSGSPRTAFSFKLTCATNNYLEIYPAWDAGAPQHQQSDVVLQLVCRADVRDQRGDSRTALSRQVSLPSYTHERARYRGCEKGPAQPIDDRAAFINGQTKIADARKARSVEAFGLAVEASENPKGERSVRTSLSQSWSRRGHRPEKERSGSRGSSR